MNPRRTWEFCCALTLNCRQRLPRAIMNLAGRRRMCKLRLPLPKRESLDEAGQKVFDHHSDPHGGSIAGLRGPGGIKLHSPKLAAAGATPCPQTARARFSRAL